VQNAPLVRLVAVFLGGIVGTALRLGADTVVPHRDDQFPLSTLLINIVGSAALGWLTSGVFSRGVSPLLKAAVGPGLLGSFTTFSAVVLTPALLTASQPPHPVLALVYLFVTLLLGFGAAILGLRLGSIGAARRSTALPEARQ
jgi:CrcB protein